MKTTMLVIPACEHHCFALSPGAEGVWGMAQTQCPNNVTSLSLLTIFERWATLLEDGAQRPDARCHIAAPALSLLSEPHVWPTRRSRTQLLPCREPLPQTATCPQTGPMTRLGHANCPTTAGTLGKTPPGHCRPLEASRVDQEVDLIIKRCHVHDRGLPSVQPQSQVLSPQAWRRQREGAPRLRVKRTKWQLGGKGRWRSCGCSRAAQ